MAGWTWKQTGGWHAELSLSPSLSSSQPHNTEEKILLALISPICRKLLAVRRGVDPPMEPTNWAPALRTAYLEEESDVCAHWSFSRVHRLGP